MGVLPTSTDLAESIMDGVREDVMRGTVPESISSFEELHEHVDANMYGLTADVLSTLAEYFPDSPEAAHEMGIMLIDRAQRTVDVWIREGRHRG